MSLAMRRGRHSSMVD